MKILVVDDKEEERYLAETLLKGNGYDVVSATNGAEALEKLRAEGFDMIISDILMPVMDGYQFCRECKEDKKLRNIPFVFYTAEYIEEGDENLALRMEVDRFIRKPIESEEFVKLIQGVFRDVEEAKKKPVVAGMKILIVEDNEDSRNLLMKQLRAYGHEIAAAADGAEALEQALAQPPDIIVSDIMMPKMDGYQLCQECKQNDKLKDIPFVFYTATYTKEEDEKLALSLGANTFIRKPSEPDVLAQMLSEIVEKAKSGALAPPKVVPLKPSLFLTKYNKRIVAKLEEKMVQLEVEITERKQAEAVLRESEERYRDLFENASDLVQSVAPDGHFLYVNRAWREILGYSEEEVANLTLWDIIHPDSIPHCQEIFQKVISGEAVSNIEAIFVAKDGKLVSVEGNANCRFKGGEVVGARGIFHDITERKQMEEVQERLNQYLQAKVSELETFSYGIAHDLRSPLVSIEGFSSLLRDDIQNQKMERVQEDFRLLESGVRRMQQFLNRTLEYSRAGQLVKQTKNVSFGEIVEEVITEFAEQVSSIGATVSLAEKFPRVYADRTRIRQVLTNLIQNSINYRDKTRPLKIEIGYRLSEDKAVFFVRDNGLGIDASETEKVFALFYRGTADGEGSGAGLAIVKRIIEAHGGRIWVESQLGKGTTMCLALPQQNGTNKGGNNGKD